MTKMYPGDLRRKLLDAARRREGSLPSLGVRFGISVGWAKSVSQALLHSGQMDWRPGDKRGSSSRFN